jgi:hypothetical protein
MLGIVEYRRLLLTLQDLEITLFLPALLICQFKCGELEAVADQVDELHPPEAVEVADPEVTLLQY